MDSRRLNLSLGILAAFLFVMNCLLLYVIFGQRVEIASLQNRLTQNKNSIAQVAQVAVRSTNASATQSLSIVLGEINEEHGLRQVYDIKDGITAPANIDGVTCRELTRPADMAKIHFTVDSNFKTAVPMNARLEVEYFDASPDGTLSVEYDGPKAYTPSERRFRLKNASEWKNATFQLTDATFEGRENGGADFRIIATKPKVFVRRVTLSKE